jgi:hypothetical protein
MKPRNTILLIASTVVGLGFAVGASLAADAPARDTCPHAKDGSQQCTHDHRAMGKHEQGKGNPEHGRMHDRMHKHQGQHAMHEQSHRDGKHAGHHEDCHGHEAAPK